MSKVLYLTSFNQELYEASGHKLIESFYEHSHCPIIGIGPKNTNVDLFVGYEQLLTKTSLYNNEIWYNLDKDIFLQKWLETNKDIIPEYLGGLAKPCKCKNPYDRHDRAHKKGCHFTWWNRNCSRWFRKIACLNQILQKPATINSYDYFIWLDADCVFKDTIPKEIWSNIFNGADVFYMRGKVRRAVESGIFGIKNSGGGLQFIKNFIHIYNTEFRKLERWDDGFIFKYAIDFNFTKSYDICANAIISEVADVSPLSRYIKHFKGRHGKGMEIMK